jgi:hypothetical protein
MPDITLSIVQPHILQILRLLTGILKAAKKNDPVFKVRHSMTTPRRRSSFAFQLRPLSRAGFKSPEVIVVVESALLWTRELPSEHVDATGVATLTHGMSTSWEGCIGASDFSPGVCIGLVDEEIVEESRQGSIEVFASEEEQFVAVRWRCY